MSSFLSPKRIRILLGLALLVLDLSGVLPVVVGGPGWARAADYGPQLFLLGPSPLQVRGLARAAGDDSRSAVQRWAGTLRCQRGP